MLSSNCKWIEKQGQSYILPWLISNQIRVIYPSLRLSDAQLSTWERSCKKTNAFNTLVFCSICLESSSWGIAALWGACSWLEFAMTTYSALPHCQTESQSFLQRYLKDWLRKVACIPLPCFSEYFLLHWMQKGEKNPSMTVFYPCLKKNVNFSAGLEAVWNLPLS